MDNNSKDTTCADLRGGGEMGDLTRSYPWENTPLGPISNWPTSLKVQVNMMLSSRFPMLIFWGKDLITFYNDAFRPSLGEDGKHPSSLGQVGEVSWAESWPTIGPMIYNIMAGGDAVWFEDQKLPLYRDGKMGYAYWTYSFSPITNDHCEVNGVLVTCSETTKAVEGMQRLEQKQSEVLALFEQAPVGVAVINKDNLTFQMANAFYGELVGRHPSQLVGKSLLDALPELTGQGFDALLEQVLSTGIPYVANEVSVDILRHGDMENIYVDLAYQPHFDEQGNISGILVAATDVTAQVFSRKAIESNEARFRSLIEEAPVATCLFTGPEMRVDIINEMMVQAWGKDMSVKGKPLIKALPELEGQPFMDILANVLATGTTYVATAARVDLVVNGVLGIYYYDFTYKPVFDVDGKIFGIINVSINVTEKVIARQQLEEAEAIMRGAVELAELGTWTIDATTMGLSVSDRMVDWFGSDPNNAAFNSVIPTLADADQDRVTKAIEWALNPASNGIYDEVFTIIHPYTGKRRILHSQGKTHFDELGNAVRINGTAQDITSQRELQVSLELLVQERTDELAAAIEELQATNEELASTNEELEESNVQLLHSNDELAQYAYVASHDLQEPLRKIQVFSGILSNAKGTADEHKVVISKISNAAERMAQLIRDLLEFSRLLKSEDLIKQLNLQETMGVVANDFELIMLEKNAKLSIGYLPRIQAIGLQMNQLFFNLISNALKFTHPDRTPELRIEGKLIDHEFAARYVSVFNPSTKYWLITVADNGIGFEHKYAEQIFEVFKRLHTRDIYPGSGIGLSLCRRIVGNHNGALFAVSEPGKGSTFNIILPEEQLAQGLDFPQ